MNQSIEFKAIPGQFNIDEAQGMVECFVAGIGNKDSVGDVLISGAFTKSLTRRKPRVVWGHNWNDPIGKVLEIYEVAPGDRRLPSKMLTAGIGGLYAKVQFNLNSEKGREAFANVAFFGQEQEWSIGYKTLDSIFDPNLQANILKEVELYEVSPVLHGANQLTGTISVKSDELSMTDDAKGGMMVVGMGGQMPNREMHRQHERRTPNILEANKPGIGDEKRNQLEIELAVRAGAPVKVRVADENMVVFDRMTPDGAPTTYRVAYHNTGREFMFGKPERVAVQTVFVPSSEESGSRVVVPSQMPSMPMQVKPSANAYMSDEQDEYQNIMPKSYDNDEKWVFDEDFADLANIISDSLDLKVGRALSAKNMSKLKAILESLHDVVSSADKEVEVKTDYIIPVQIENAFETKQLLDPIFDYHRVESHVTEDGIVVTSGVTQDFMDAIGVAEKALGQRLGGGLGKLGRAARGAANFDPKAWDGDGDGLVQEGTPYQRPAVPGVNDRSTGGRVNADAATRAFRQQGGKPADSKKPSGGLASSGRPEPIKKQGEFFGSPVYDEFNGQYVEGEVIALSDLYGDDRPGYAIVGRYDMDGQGTVGDFYGGDDEEFETIEDAMDFLENIEKEGEEDRFYDDPEFRSVDRKRSAGRPGERPLSGLASSSKKFDVNDRAQRVEKITEMYMNGSTVPDISQYFRSLNPSDRRVMDIGNITSIIDKQRKNGIIPLRSNMPNRITKKQRERDKEILRLWNEGELEPSEIAKFTGTNVTNVYGVVRRSRLANESAVRRGDKERGLASSSDMGKKPEALQGEIVSGPGAVTPAMKQIDKAVTRGVVAPEHAEIIRDILSDLTPESLKDGEGGDILGEIRRKFVKAVQSGKFDNYKDATTEEDSLDNYIDYQLKELISNALLDTLEANINRRYASKKQNDVYDEIRDEVVTEFVNNLSDAIKVSNKNKPPSDENIAAAKDRARKKLAGLIGDLEDGGKEAEITSQELYEIVREIVADDPSVDVANMFRLLERAAEEGYNSNSDNYKLEKLYEELEGQSQNKGTLEEFEELKLDSEYLPERVEARRTLAGGLASSGRMRDEDNFDEYDEAFGPTERGSRRGMPNDPVGDAASENIDRDRNAGAVRSGLASTARGEGTMLARDGQIRRDERGNIDPTEAREVRAAFDQNIFNKLRELGFNDDEIEKLTGVADGGRVAEGAKPAQYVPDDIRKGGLASESRAPGKGVSGNYLQRVNRQPSTSGTDVLDNSILMDFLSGMTAKEVNEKYNLGGPSFAYRAANREFGRLRRNSDSRANSDMDLLMYRASGLSVKETAELFNMSPREVRKTEKRLQAKLRNNIDDEDLLYLRSGLSLEEAGELLGVEPKKLRQMEQAASRRNASKIEKAKGTGRIATGGRDTDKREMDMTLAEYAELDEVLKKYTDDSQLDGVGADEDMQIIQNILDKIDESSDANDSIPLTDKEIDDYIDTLTRMKDNGPVEDGGDKDAIAKLIESLKKTKDSSDKYYGSDALKESGTRLTPVADAQKRTPKTVRAFRSTSGTINPHKKLDIELTEDEIGLLRDEVEMLSRTGENKNIFRAIQEKLENAKNGKFSIDNTEYEEVVKAIEQSKSRSGAVSSDILGVLEQAAETSDGNFSSLNLRGGGLASTNNGKKPNNGAPPDITEAMQKEYIFWARSANARNLRLVQDALKDFEKEDGQLSPSTWKRLRTMYENMGPGSGRGGRRMISGSGGGKRARTGGLASSSDDYSRRPKQSGVPGAMRPSDFEVREEGGAGKGSAMGAESGKFAGLSLDEAKPGNWDELSNDEKFDWLMYEGNPEKVSEKGQRMSLAAHEGAIKKVLQDMEREERRSMTPGERRAARAEEQANISEVELERQRVAREARNKKTETPKKTYKPAPDAKKAKSVRQDELGGYQDYIEETKIKLSDLEGDGEFNPSAEDIWETVYALLGDDDMSKRSIEDAIGALDDYIETASPGENKYEKTSIRGASALLKKLNGSKAKYEDDPWILDDRPRVGGMASRAKDGDRPRPGSREMPQSQAKRSNEMKKIIDLAQQVIDEMKSNQNSNNGRKARVGGLASSSRPKAMITDEATFFKDIESSLQKEIRAAQKAKNKDAVAGLSKLQEIITRNEASKTGSRRTNVGSIYLTDDEADMVLNGLMFALDNQIELGGDKRIEWYSKLLEKVSKAAMSTFINKNT